jgi:multicomponent Na+:H+ antiporter subunit D
MIAELSPALILIVGAVLVPLLPRGIREVYMLALPAVAAFDLMGLPMGESGKLSMLGLQLVTVRVDALSLLFAYVFLIATALAVVFAWHVRDTIQQVATLIYAGSALGGVLAGDLVTLFLYWEGTAIASVILIWASRSEASYRAGMRYLLLQVGSGVLLLAGAMLHYKATGSIAFGTLGLDGSPGKTLILLAIAIKCAFPLVHTWVPDAYPAATPTGTVALSAFTTKLAVYTLVRGYPGTELLIPVGMVMALVPIVWALTCNDLRRALSYGMVQQLGIMVVGVGIGTELALAGAVAHAFCSILYTALLFMALGAVVHRTGTAKASELGHLARAMPWTAGLCLLGAASISAVPLFSAFVAKSLVIGAAQKAGMAWVWLALLLASLGGFLHSGLRVPLMAFFARPERNEQARGIEEAPLNMLVAMGAAAALSIAIGVAPGLLYDQMPKPVLYEPYTVDHVLTQLQLLVLGGLAFFMVWQRGMLAAPRAGEPVDIDRLWRGPGRRLLLWMAGVAGVVWHTLGQATINGSERLVYKLRHHHGPDGALGRNWPTGTMALWATIMLGAYLLLSFVASPIR